MENDKEIKCSVCEDSGWVLHQVFQDLIHADMSVFVHKLYVECVCKKEKKTA